MSDDLQRACLAVGNLAGEHERLRARCERLEAALRKAHAFFSAGLACADFDDSPAERAEHAKIKARLDAMLEACAPTGGN